MSLSLSCIVSLICTLCLTTVDADAKNVPTNQDQMAGIAYDGRLHLAHTPFERDSMICVWQETNAQIAYDDFFREYIDYTPTTLESNIPDSVYINRLRDMASPIQLPYNNIVKSYILRYTNNRYGTISNIISLSQYYFPIFEEELIKAGLPVELKALAIIESALSPTAISRAGAVGLWQFMPTTGKSYGLEINSLVDERRDPVAATRAACRYLKALYNIFGDWTLAIASYNCGPGNVNKALARAGENSKTFWDIYYYLPRETRGYVPAFIGALYAYTYHTNYNVKYKKAPMPIATDTITIKKIMHLKQVSSTIDLPIDILRRLNPQYKMDIIPATNKHYSLVLPQQYIGRYIAQEAEILAKDSLYLKEYITPSNFKGAAASSSTGATKRVHIVKKGDTVAAIARRYSVSTAQIIKWNKLSSVSKIMVGQKLIISK